MPSREAAQLGVSGLGSHLGDGGSSCSRFFSPQTRIGVHCEHEFHVKGFCLFGGVVLRAPLVDSRRGGEVS
jgi:hypothetical protein